jgi:hypothetical protein
MRLTEVFMAFPTIILAMAIAAALGPSLANAVIAMVVVWWPNYARVVRSLVIGVKSQEYVEAAQALGVPRGRVLWRTVLPNCLAPAVVLATIDLGNAILVFAGLSFLGLGPDPTTPEWGRMVADGIQYFDQWWIAAFAGLAIFTVVMAFNFRRRRHPRRAGPAAAEEFVTWCVLTVSGVTRHASGRHPPGVIRQASSVRRCDLCSAAQGRPALRPSQLAPRPLLKSIESGEMIMFDYSQRLARVQEAMAAHWRRPALSERIDQSAVPHRDRPRRAELRQHDVSRASG